MNGVTVNLTRGRKSSQLPESTEFVADCVLLNLVLDEAGRYMSLMDTGSSDILVRYDELVAIAGLVNGPVIFENEHDLYFDCSIPQLLELKYSDQWFPVDPLDIINPNDHGNVNGTEMYVLACLYFCLHTRHRLLLETYLTHFNFCRCKAQISSWSRAFGDSIIGVPFLRSAFSVFDYVTPDFYSVQPRVGLAPLVDGSAAIARYPEVYRNRLL